MNCNKDFYAILNNVIILGKKVNRKKKKKGKNQIQHFLVK